jgi:hypothetical protein
MRNVEIYSATNENEIEQKQNKKDAKNAKQKRIK